MNRTVEIYIIQDVPEDGGLFSAIAPRINWAAAYGSTKDEALNRLITEVMPLMIESILDGYDTTEIPESYIEKQEYTYQVA